MSRLEYTLNMLVVVVFVVLYFAKDNDIVWLFAAAFQLIHVKTDQIIGEIKKQSKND